MRAARLLAIASLINLFVNVLSNYAELEQPLSRRALSQQADNCSETIGVDASNMLQGSNPLDLVGVKGISYSIGYSVTDSFLTAQSLESPNQACSLKMAKIINKAGVARYPNADGAQAAVRSTNFNDPVEQQCPGAQCVITDSFFFPIFVSERSFHCKLGQVLDFALMSGIKIRTTCTPYPF